MNSTLSKVSPKTTQKVNLVDGNFTVSEASDIVSTLINDKINFHKLQRLSLCEGFAGANTKYPDERIAELENEKITAKEFFTQARAEGFSIKINGTLEISINED